MRIALLNLPFDCNYGGNLQRYALIKVLKDRGHFVRHINLIGPHSQKWIQKPYTAFKTFMRCLFLNKYSPDIFVRIYMNLTKDRYAQSLRFYEKYIPHTCAVHTVHKISNLVNGHFEVCIVGSDQVWRPDMTSSIGIENYFLKFITDTRIKKIAYAASLGKETPFDTLTVQTLSPLYKQFDAVSVREYSALSLLQKSNWNNPQPILVLDPTMLLQANDYKLLISKGNTENKTENKIFCYILDESQEVMQSIFKKSKEMHLLQYCINLKDAAKVSIEQWLSNIANSKLVMTDSYHGVVFSIIFNKPFLFMGNNRRGNTRVFSLYKILDINPNNTMNLDWDKINERVSQMRKISFDFIDNSVSTQIKV